VVLFEFGASEPSANPTPSVAVMVTSAIRDVLLHVGSNTAYLSTAAGYQTCSYVVSSGIDMSSCSGHQTSNSIATILRTTVASTDYLLIGTNSGLFVPDNPAQPDNSLTNLQKALQINGLAADGQNLWVATSGGLYVVSLTATKPFKDDSVFKLIASGPSNLSDIVLGATDSVWVGNGSGLARYTPSTGTWQMWSAAGSDGIPSLASDDVRALAVSHPVIAGATRDVIWIATGAGVSRFDSQLESFTTFTSVDGLPSDSIRAVLVLANGDKLFGTDSGIALYKGL
jgi:ligand-binding sensor domain-containing protein